MANVGFSSLGTRTQTNFPYSERNGAIVLPFLTTGNVLLPIGSLVTFGANAETVTLKTDADPHAIGVVVGWDNTESDVYTTKKAVVHLFGKEILTAAKAEGAGVTLGALLKQSSADTTTNASATFKLCVSTDYADAVCVKAGVDGADIIVMILQQPLYVA